MCNVSLELLLYWQNDQHHPVWGQNDQALPYFVTPKAVDENSALLQQLPHWAACSITQALEFLTPAYKGHPRVMAYVLRVLESYPPERVTFFMPQLVQALRYDEEVYYLIKAFIVFIVLGGGAVCG